MLVRYFLVAPLTAECCEACGEVRSRKAVNDWFLAFMGASGHQWAHYYFEGPAAVQVTRLLELQDIRWARP